jgi:hypothetical protein
MSDPGPSGGGSPRMVGTEKNLTAPDSTSAASVRLGCAIFAGSAKNLRRDVAERSNRSDSKEGNYVIAAAVAAT